MDARCARLRFWLQPRVWRVLPDVGILDAEGADVVLSQAKNPCIAETQQPPDVNEAFDNDPITARRLVLTPRRLLSSPVSGKGADIHQSSAWR
jgi:hypothetical protein